MKKHVTHHKKHHKAKHATTTQKTERLPYGMQQTKEIPSSEAKWPEKQPNTFTPMETGRPGPLDQEGEGDRQNDQLAELEQIEPRL